MRVKISFMLLKHRVSLVDQLCKGNLVVVISMVCRKIKTPGNFVKFYIFHLTYNTEPFYGLLEDVRLLAVPSGSSSLNSLSMTNSYLGDE